MTADICAKVRESAKTVAEAADMIRINEDRIDGYAAELLAKYPLITTLDDATHFVSEDDPTATLRYLLALDSINFGSGFFDVAAQAGVALEYDIIARGLKSAFIDGVMDDAKKWVLATPAQCHDVFTIPAGAHPALDRLMDLFARHLNMTGDRVVSAYGGDVTAMLVSATGSAVALAGTVAAWPTFRDVAVYKGREIAVYKRAQIFVADVYLALRKTFPAADFRDMAALTIFADNMVPHVLRHDGVLDYAPELAARIDSGDMIEPGSAEETEIRAVAIHAVECLKQSAQKQGHDVTSVNLDHILWHRGYEPALYALPRHKTMTVWY